MSKILEEMAKDAMVNGDRTPFLKDDDKLYCRFDRLEIRPTEKDERGLFGSRRYDPHNLVVDIYLEGQLIHTISMPDTVYFESGGGLSIRGLLGYLPIETRLA